MDPMIGLADGREFFGWLEEHAEGEPVALALFDLDATSSPNDQLRAEEVEQLLTRLGTLMRGRCAVSEVAARVGGELFALGLLEDELEEVMIEVERIRLSFRAATEGATLTVGICDSESLRHSAEELTLFQAAEDALDKAKKQGPEGLVVFH